MKKIKRSYKLLFNSPETPPKGSELRTLTQTNKVQEFQISVMATTFLIITPNCTIPVHFGGISGQFGQAMVCISRRRKQAPIPMARPNQPDMPLKHTKKGCIRYFYHTQIWPSDHDILGYRTEDRSSDWLIKFVNLGTVITDMLRSIFLTLIFTKYQPVQIFTPNMADPLRGGKKALPLSNIVIKAEKGQ